jgi:hypothetical protein
MVEDLGAGEVTIPGEVAEEVAVTRPVDPLAAQDGLVAERFLQRLADLLLAEEAELSRVVLAAGADVIEEQGVLGDLVRLLGVIPVPSGIGKEQAVPIDHGVVDGDDARIAGAGEGILLEPLQASLVEGLGIPDGLGEVAIEAGLIGGPGELVRDPEDRLALGNDQSGQVLGAVAALALVGEEVTGVGQGVLDQLGKLNNPWQDPRLRSPTAPERIEGKTGSLYLF